MRAIRRRSSPGRSFRCVSCATRIRASSAETRTRAGARHCARYFDAGVAGYYPRRVADFELHLGGFVPGDHQGAQRGCDPGQGRSAGKPQGKCHLRSPDPRRYGPARLRQPCGRFESRAGIAPAGAVAEDEGGGLWRRRVAGQLPFVYISKKAAPERVRLFVGAVQCIKV